MDNRNKKLITVINIILPIIIAAGFSFVLIQNYIFNSSERVHSFSDCQNNQEDSLKFVFDDVTVDISTRGGDSGSWISNDSLADNKGNVLYNKAVGTIYELTLINNTSDTITDWQATVYIPERMYANNTWNGDIEFHQNVKNNQQVQTLNLSEYSKYDITLENYNTAVGPMLAMYEGDYFVYFPNADMSEVPIAPKPQSSNKESSAKIGFIMYIPERAVDYVADFSKGEVRFRLQRSIVKNPFFWVLCVLSVIWVSYVIAMIIVNSNLKRFKEQKARDEKTIDQIMQTFVNFIEAKDPNTMGHSLRVAKYSVMIAKKMGFDEEGCKQIRCIALMHDCGKIYIPDEILTKPGRLTAEEFEVMKKHTIYGKEILRDFNAIDNMGMGALCHHERYDGSGYPNRLAGEEIPLIARIIGVSDAFDAMNSRRCYRNNLPKELILSELEVNKGTQFDPKIADCLLELIKSGDISIWSENDETAQPAESKA